MSMIIARQKELTKLERLVLSPKSEFVAVYGRRRIGKTYLISEYFQDKGVYFEITGIQNSTREAILRKFHDEFSKIFVESSTLAAPKDWHEALKRLVEKAKAIPKNRKIIIFLDELPWLATPRSNLLKELDYYWNRHFSRMENVILIICGSAAAWMIQHIIRNKGGLYGRLSDHIYLQPFTLDEMEQYLKNQQIHLDRQQMIELYMAMGGVAKYLSLIRRGISAAQIINELCFTTQGSLLTEFTDLYRSLFGSAENHISIIKVLAKKRYGLLREDLLQALGRQTGGQMTKALEELEESGFILSLHKFGQKNKEKRIRLSDEYSYFYLEFIEPVRGDIMYGADDSYWQKMQSGRRWPIWSGYAFETLCLKHINQIKQALGIASIITMQSHWFYRAKDKNEVGVEIDLLLDRADDCINLFEFKFCKEEYVLTKEYAQKLAKKREVFRQQTKTKKTIFITMITPYGIKKNEHSIGIVDKELTMDALFDS